MADFNQAQPYIIKNEGGYCDTPGDKGGETYCGIARNYYPNWGGWTIIDQNKPLTYNEKVEDTTLSAMVDQFYKKQFWDGLLGDSIASQPVATYLYDFYVNAMHNAVKCLQRIVEVTADGSFGNGTLASVNAYTGDLLTELNNARIAYYRSIAVGENAKFLNGWINRANEMYSALTS